jgi:hypothetical protein
VVGDGEAQGEGAPDASLAHGGEWMARTAPSWYGQLGPGSGPSESKPEGAVSQERLKRDLTRVCQRLTRDR